MLLPLLTLAVQASSIQVHWIDDEPRAVLSILESPSPTEAQWSVLFQTEGYQRLKGRESGIGRPFTDDEFRKFVSSPELKAQAADLRRTLTDWGRIDFNAAGKTALAYLPSNASLAAKVYPLIKPRTNSFVWDVGKDPAIMLYLDPHKGSGLLRTTVTHEMHHIGYASCCPSPEFKAWTKTLPEGLQKAWVWIGAFGEGYAVLAAAPGLKADPMANFTQDVKDAWNHGIENLAGDMTDITHFLTDTADEKLKGDDVAKKASTFYGLQGPWYTVGYIQATTIEKAFGRKKLIVCYQDPRELMPTYNQAVGKLHLKLPVWPEELINALNAPKLGAG